MHTLLTCRLTRLAQLSSSKLALDHSVGQGTEIWARHTVAFQSVHDPTARNTLENNLNFTEKSYFSMNTAVIAHVEQLSKAR